VAVPGSDSEAGVQLKSNNPVLRSVAIKNGERYWRIVFPSNCLMSMMFVISRFV
jgi:hypothetical protein